jgi:tetratricopeptide (TPR) repeat protein
MRRYLLACVAVFVALALAEPDNSGLLSPAFADQKDERLPDLFTQLKQAPDADTATAIEQKIWRIWFESGSAELDALLAEGADAMGSNDFKTALDRFNLIIKKRPDFAEGWNRRATLYYLMGEYKQSLADIDRTLQLEPRHIGALSGLGLVNTQLDKLEAAEDAYKRVLAISPRNAGAQRSLDAVRAAIKKRSI